MQSGVGPGPYRRRLRHDSTFWLELQFCTDHGIPHSEFLAWAPEDRAKTIAFLTEKGLRCQMCGTASWEWEQDIRAYEPVVVDCMGCYHRETMGAETDRRPGARVELLPAKGRSAERRHWAEHRAYLEAQQARRGQS